MSDPTRILLTGFGAFPGARSNPTVEIVRRLARAPRFARLGLRVEARILPVTYGEIAGALRAAVEEAAPHAILLLGLAGRRKALSLETRAVNRIGRLRADAARRLSLSSAVCPGGASALKSRWPAPRLLAAMNAAGAKTRLSIDAGDYLCNQALYLALETTRAPAGFIHVPRPRRRGEAARGGRPSLADMVRAIEAAVVHMAAESRRGRP